MASDSSFNYLHVDARLIDIVDDEWRKDTLGDDEIVSVKVADIVDDRDDLVNAKPKAIDPVERWLDLDLGSLGVPTPNNPQQPSR